MLKAVAPSARCGCRRARPPLGPEFHRLWTTLSRLERELIVELMKDWCGDAQQIKRRPHLRLVLGGAR
jgi:hypothetical protein